MRIIFIIFNFCLLVTSGFADTSRVTVSASWYEKQHCNPECVPENTLDGDFNKRSSWRSQGDGQWIQYNLGDIKKITSVKIAFMKGDTRIYSFDIAVSTDTLKWVEVYTGKSSGKTLEFEKFTFESVTGSYVRLIGHGNSNAKFPDWFNVTEVEINFSDL